MFHRAALGNQLPGSYKFKHGISDYLQFHSLEHIQEDGEHTFTFDLDIQIAHPQLSSNIKMDEWNIMDHTLKYYFQLYMEFRRLSILITVFFSSLLISHSAFMKSFAIALQSLDTKFLFFSFCFAFFSFCCCSCLIWQIIMLRDCSLIHISLEIPGKLLCTDFYSDFTLCSLLLSSYYSVCIRSRAAYCLLP